MLSTACDLVRVLCVIDGDDHRTVVAPPRGRPLPALTLFLVRADATRGRRGGAVADVAGDVVEGHAVLAHRGDDGAPAAPSWCRPRRSSAWPSVAVASGQCRSRESTRESNAPRTSTNEHERQRTVTDIIPVQRVCSGSCRSAANPSAEREGFRWQRRCLGEVPAQRRYCPLTRRDLRATARATSADLTKRNRCSSASVRRRPPGSAEVQSSIASSKRRAAATSGGRSCSTVAATIAWSVSK